MSKHEFGVLTPDDFRKRGEEIASNPALLQSKIAESNAACGRVIETLRVAASNRPTDYSQALHDVVALLHSADRIGPPEQMQRISLSARSMWLLTALASIGHFYVTRVELERCQRSSPLPPQDGA